MVTPPTATIRTAESATDYERAKELIHSHAEALGMAFCFIGFEEELASLSRIYGPPGGVMLLACEGESVLGCVAYRTLSEGVCEMKRMYVVPAARGRDLGRRLAEELLARARRAGFKRMLLDTLPTMHAAQSLYRSLGFMDAEAYNDNPIPGVTYMAIELTSPSH